MWFASTLSLIFVTPLVLGGEFPICSICGDGQVLGRPDFSPLPGDGETTCAKLEAVAADGDFPEAMCSHMKSVAGSKCCETPVDSRHGGSDCHLCDDPEHVIVTPEGDTASTCFTLRQVLEMNDVPGDLCDELKGYTKLEGCTCGEPGTTVAETASPTLAPTSNPSSAPIMETFDASSNEDCNICGDGKVVTSPSSELVAGAPSTQCGLLNEQGLDGKIPPRVCENIQRAAASSCGCSDLAEVSTAGTYPVCFVCGQGKVVTKPNAALIPGIPSTQCAKVENQGLAGALTPVQCDAALHAVPGVCECESDSFKEEELATLHPICSLCGDMEMTKPEASLIPGSPATQCGKLEILGQEGKIPEPVCRDMRRQNRYCGCKEPVFEDAEVDDDLPNPVCNICGDGLFITIPTGAVIPGANSTQCAQLQELGSQGQIPAGVCANFQDLAVNECGCSVAPTNATAGCIELMQVCDPTENSPCCDEAAVCEGICTLPKKDPIDEESGPDSDSNTKLFDSDVQRGNILRRRRLPKGFP